MRALRQLLAEVETRAALWRCTRVGTHPRVLGRIWIHGGGRIVLGDRVVLDGRLVPIELKVEPDGELCIGDDVHIEGGASIEASHAITIGARCHVGAFAKLMDNHFHRLTGDHMGRPPAGAIVLEDDVRLGARSIVLPGSHLQHAVILEPRTVISRRVPAGTTLAGHPARPVMRGRSP